MLRQIEKYWAIFRYCSWKSFVKCIFSYPYWSVSFVFYQLILCSGKFNFEHRKGKQNNKQPHTCTSTKLALWSIQVPQRHSWGENPLSPPAVGPPAPQHRRAPCSAGTPARWEPQGPLLWAGGGFLLGFKQEITIFAPGCTKPRMAWILPILQTRDFTTMLVVQVTH